MSLNNKIGLKTKTDLGMISIMNKTFSFENTRTSGKLSALSRDVRNRAQLLPAESKHSVGFLFEIISIRMTFFCFTNSGGVC